MAVGDLDRDGIPDLVVANASDNDVSVLLGKGDGTFHPAVDYRTGATGTEPMAVPIADFDGDGRADLAMANFQGHNVSVLLGNGDGSFQETVDYAISTQSLSQPLSIATGDFNGDGRLDVAVANEFSNDVSVLLNVSH